MDMSSGFFRFIIGLGKKVILANHLSIIVEQFFGTEGTAISVAGTWYAVIVYAMHIYFDFSGYSDMAIGMGEMFGFHFDENFRHPFLCKDISEFWQRWHISLGTFFRDYLLYVPIFGKRRKYGGLFLVWFCTGLWHGASWNFIFWGLWHGFFIIVERITSWHKKEFNAAGNAVRHLCTILIFIIGWVMFRAETMTYAAKYILRMFGLGGATEELYYWHYFISNTEILIMAAALICSMPIFRNLIYVKEGKFFLERKILLNLWLLILFVLSAASIADATFNPFIYFRF